MYDERDIIGRRRAADDKRCVASGGEDGFARR